MTDSDKSDPRRIHIGPASDPKEDNALKNVFQMPTEVINHRVEPTIMFERTRLPHASRSNKERVKAAVNKCQTALTYHSKPKIDREEKVENNGTKLGQIERHTFAASSLRRREINEKCETIREVTLTALTIAMSISIVIFMIWLQILLYSWTHP